MVALAASDSSFVTRSTRSAARANIRNRTFRDLLAEIDRSQRAVQDSIDQATGPIKRLLEPIGEQTQQLVDQAHMLANKGQIIEAFLAQMDYAKLRQQIDKIDEKIEQTTDTYTIQQLEETRKALVNRRKNAQDLETFIGRITAQLQNIDANLDNTLSETIRLRTADAISANSSSNQIADHLSNLNADMSAFRQVLDTTMLQSGAMGQNP
jgi:tetrahydromethanopterin S-methyltransferase subunit G